MDGITYMPSWDVWRAINTDELGSPFKLRFLTGSYHLDLTAKILPLLFDKRFQDWRETRGNRRLSGDRGGEYSSQVRIKLKWMDIVGPN